MRGDGHVSVPANQESFLVRAAIRQGARRIPTLHGHDGCTLGPPLRPAGPRPARIGTTRCLAVAAASTRDPPTGARALPSRRTGRPGRTSVRAAAAAAGG